MTQSHEHVLHERMRAPHDHVTWPGGGEKCQDGVGGCPGHLRQHTEHTEHQSKLYGRLDWVWCCKTPSAPPVATRRPARTRPCSPCDQQQPDAVASPPAPPVPSTSTTSPTRLPHHALSVRLWSTPLDGACACARSSGAAISILIHCYCFVHVPVVVLVHVLVPVVRTILYW